MELTRIRELVAEKLGQTEREMTADLPLAELEWDSLDFLELAVALEQEFDIRLVDARLIRCQNIGEVEELVEAALREYLG